MSGQRRMNGVGTGTASGTFGELLQGVLLQPELDFLVTFPIARGSRATFRLDPDGSTVRVEPAHKLKSARLAAMMLTGYGFAGGGTLTIDSDLPEGKGMASSSADLVATARAVGDALNVAITPGAVVSLLRSIEPTDGVMYDGAVAFYHREVRLLARFGPLPRLTVVGIDEGGEIDTIQFNHIPKPFSAADRREYGRLLRAAAVAVRVNDLATIGAIATRSAELCQKMRARPALPDAIGVCRSVGGLGIVAAHSGTTLGVLLAEDDPQYPHRLDRARRACANLAGSTWVDHSADPLAGYAPASPWTRTTPARLAPLRAS